MVIGRGERERFAAPAGFAAMVNLISHNRQRYPPPLGHKQPLPREAPWGHPASSGALAAGQAGPCAAAAAMANTVQNKASLVTHEEYRFLIVDCACPRSRAPGPPPSAARCSTGRCTGLALRCPSPSPCGPAHAAPAQRPLPPALPLSPPTCAPPPPCPEQAPLTPTCPRTLRR